MGHSRTPTQNTAGDGFPADPIDGYFALPVGWFSQAADGTAGMAAGSSRGTPACAPLSAARYARTRWARGCPTCSRARIARTDGTRPAASSTANAYAACVCSGSVAGMHSGAPPRAVSVPGSWAERMIIMSSSYEPTSATGSPRPRRTLIQAVAASWPRCCAASAAARPG